jgi:hypothetical protein
LGAGRPAQPEGSARRSGVAADLGDGNGQVKDLLERQIVADLVRGLRGDQKRLAGRDHARPVAVKDGVVAADVLEQRRGDVTLAGEVVEEPAQPRLEARPGRLTLDGLRGRGQGVDLRARLAEGLARRREDLVAIAPRIGSPRG